jgi:N-terminal domain of anti-restriction factor ArdC
MNIARQFTFSLHNVLLITLQKPNASHVAGFRTWTKLGRFVRKGEKGILILAPMVETVSEEDPCHREIEVRRVVGFCSAYVSKDYLVICGRAFARSMASARATLESPLNSSKHIIAQVLCPAQRFLMQGMQGFQLSASFVHQSGF